MGMSLIPSPEVSVGDASYPCDTVIVRITLFAVRVIVPERVELLEFLVAVKVIVDPLVSVWLSQVSDTLTV